MLTAILIALTVLAPPAPNAGFMVCWTRSPAICR